MPGATIPDCTGVGVDGEMVIVGPVGPGPCADAVRVVSCDAEAVSLPRATRLSGVGVWDIGVDPAGVVIELSFCCVEEGAGVTVSDSAAVSSPLNAGATKAWSARTAAGIGGPLTVTTTAAAEVDVVWTEVI